MGLFSSELGTRADTPPNKKALHEFFARSSAETAVAATRKTGGSLLDESAKTLAIKAAQEATRNVINDHESTSLPIGDIIKAVSNAVSTSLSKLSRAAF